MTQKDANQKGKGSQPASASDQGGSPEAPKGKSPKGKSQVTMFLQADVDKAVSEATKELQGRLTEQGRKIAGMETNMKLVPLVNLELDDLRQRNTTLQKRIDDGELEGVKGDPDLFDATKRNRAFNEREANIKTREQTLGLRELSISSDMEDLGTLRHQGSLTRICVERGVPVEAVAALNPKTEEEMTVYADNIAKAGGYTPPETQPTGGAPPVLESGTGAGVGLDRGDMSADEKLKEGFRKANE